MHTRWTFWLCALTLLLITGATAQDNSSPQGAPVLKTRPHDRSSSQGPAGTQSQPSGALVCTQASSIDVPPNAIPQGTHFILGLDDTLDTRNLEPGQHFTAELSEDLFTSSGLVIPRGRAIHGHVATFEHGFTGARMVLAMDEIETGGGWVPLIATFTGVPGDPSIKSTGQEGEITQRGPDKKRVITNALIGAGVGAATGAAAGGGKGAAAGAIAGAGLGTTSSFLFKGNDLKLDKGTQLEVRLDRNLVVPSH